MNSVVTRWKNGEVPILNGVVQAVGLVHLVHPVDAPRSLPMTLQQGGEAEMGVLSEIGWTRGIPADVRRDAETHAVVIVGECGMGSDGFVAMQATDDPDSLQWLAFFDFSNPFESVSLAGDFIKARNNLGEEWCFDRPSPWEIEIRPAA